MRLGVVADDFTGASDIANTIAKGVGKGLATTLYLGVPTEDAADGTEAGVVALKSRSAPLADAVAQSLAALAWLRAQGAEQIVFKVCSTFDSTPAGNIGPVAEALADALGAAIVPVCPAFPGTGRTLYQGHLFVNDRLLSESGMEKHPLNPMTDPDIRRWLRRQTQGEVGLVPWQTVRHGADAIASALSATRGLVVVDAITDDDLVAIGRASAGTKLLVGGSGIALGLPANFLTGQGKPAVVAGVAGPEAILAGSCSGATRGQVERHARDHPALAIDVDAVMDGATTADALVAFLRENAGREPLVYSSATPETVAALQQRHGREPVAERLDALFADTARTLVAEGVRRLVVAGGETSGAVVTALGLTALQIGPEIDPGVPVLVSPHPAPLALALKSGNFGAPDFFTRALARLGAEAHA